MTMTASGSNDHHQLHLDGHNDFFKNHTSSSGFGGVSLRDVNVASSRPHRRSRSAGRTTTRSRDIVQDVYDRMGVSYNRGMLSMDHLEGAGPGGGGGGNPPSLEGRPHSRGRSLRRNDGSGPDGSTIAEKFQDRYKAAATRGRGRTTEQVLVAVELEDERRARSLSRGRMAARWPPANNANSLASTNNTILQTPSRPESVNINPQPPVPNENVISSLQTPKDRASFSVQGTRGRSSYTVNTKEDEKKEEDPSPPMEEKKREPPQRRPSIKDRITAYAGAAPSATTSRNVRRSYNTQFSSPPQNNNIMHNNKRELPPKVDIYATPNQVVPSDDVAEVDPMIFMARDSNNSTAVPSTVTAVSHSAAELSAANNEKVHNSASSISAGSRSSKNGRLAVADAFLAAISSPVKPQASQSTSPRHTMQGFPIVEIPSSDEVSGGGAGAGADVGSLAASSVSGDEFGVSPIHSKSSQREVVVGVPPKKSTFRNDRFGSAATTGPMSSGKTGPSFNNVGTMMTQEMIEKYIDQRIQTEIAEVENRFALQFRRLEEKYKSRIEYLEKMDHGGMRPLSGPAGKRQSVHY